MFFITYQKKSNNSSIDHSGALDNFIIMIYGKNKKNTITGNTISSHFSENLKFPENIYCIRQAKIFTVLGEKKNEKW